MTLCDLKRDGKAIVLKIDCPQDVRERLVSLGLYAGAKLTLLRVSPLRHTYLVQAGASRVAMRREVAQEVHVWPI